MNFSIGWYHGGLEMALGILKLKSRQVYGDCVHLDKGFTTILLKNIYKVVQSGMINTQMNMYKIFNCVYLQLEFVVQTIPWLPSNCCVHSGNHRKPAQHRGSHSQKHDLINKLYSHWSGCQWWAYNGGIPTLCIEILCSLWNWTNPWTQYSWSY